MKGIKENKINIFSLFASVTLKKTLWVALSLVGVQSILFFTRDETMRTFPEYWAVKWTYFVALGLCFFICHMEGVCEHGGYTLKRLGFSRKELFPLFLLHNFCSFLLIWAVQALILLGTTLIQYPPQEGIGYQSPFLVHRLGNFYSCVVPLDWQLGLQIISGFILISSASAFIPLRKMRGMSYKRSYVAFYLFCSTLSQYSYGESNLLFTGVFLLCAVLLWKGGTWDENQSIGG